MTDDTLDQIYTLAEAADRLRMTNRGLARVAKRTGFCSQDGRNLLFSERDLLAIWHAMRVTPTPPIRFAVNSPAVGVLSEDKAFSRLLARATRKRQKRSESKLQQKR